MAIMVQLVFECSRCQVRAVVHAPLELRDRVVPGSRPGYMMSMGGDYVIARDAVPTPDGWDLRRERCSECKEPR